MKAERRIPSSAPAAALLASALAVAGVALPALSSPALSSPAPSSPAPSSPAEAASAQDDVAERVIVLGIDGMDHALTEKMMAEGELPHFRRLAEQGTFAPLATSVPPLSPVAWSDFITGMDGGGHGIFDFIHRDPETMLPYLSTSQPRERPWRIGPIEIPFLTTSEMTLLRHGEAFWDPLEDAGVETWILRVPANFPVTGTASREISGMGTPDVLGTYGTFSFYTSELFAFAGEEIGGGDVYEVDAFDDVVEASLHGPKVGEEAATADFTVYIDPEEPAARFVIEDGEEFILNEGEWSPWIGVELAAGTTTIPGICRFYLRAVRPEFELYVTPINVDPREPIMPISHPEGFAGELAEATGDLFYTQGMPEDTRAFDEGIFTRDEFLAQARMAGEELIAQWWQVLEEFEKGLLFYYFGNIDQTSHMLFDTLDPEHPAHDPEVDPAYAQVIPDLYRRMDGVLGETMERIGEGTRLIVMSDHGFASWRRSFHLNAWLRDEGYLAVEDPNRTEDPGVFANVDWSKTRAYGQGFNGLYLNLAGRERDGIVDPAEKDALLAEIGEKLLAVRDPGSGEPAITRIYVADEYFEDRGHLDIGPDMVVGYAERTRVADDSALGGVSEKQIFADNLRAWGGDHSMDHTTVPGVLFVNGELKRRAESLKELGPAIVAELGIDWNPRGEAPADE